MDYRPRKTADAVVGENIRRLRTSATPKLSQRALAVHLSEITGERGWLDRIVRMEGTEDGPTGQKHRSASWTDLISLTIALETTLFELVLPNDDETQVIVAKSSMIERSELPDGRPKTMTTSYVHASDRDELARLLFALRGDSLTADNLERLSKLYETGAADAMLDINSVQEGLEKALQTLADLRKQQESKDGIDS